MTNGMDARSGWAVDLPMPSHLPFRDQGAVSAEQPGHGVGLDQLAGLVEVVVDDRGRVDAEGVVDRRQQLAGVDRVVDAGRSRSCRTCRGRGRRLMPGAGEDRGVAVRPVVAAVGAVAVAGGADALLRAAAELADGDDQRLFEQPALVEVGEQAREARRRASGRTGSCIRLVRSTWWSHEWLSELATLGQMTSTTSRAGLDQPAGQQAALAERVAAVQVAGLVGLGLRG